jgi:metal-dependent amidase/aminoacylase/carboxypeptidase family protein
MDHKERADVAFADVEDDLRSISKWMYENPELGYEEHEASARLAAFLGRHGFDVTFPAYGLETAFEATVGSSGPREVICSEYDAIPRDGHACGNNVIDTSYLGAGVSLAALADELGNRVTVLGTPAE